MFVIFLIYLLKLWYYATYILKYGIACACARVACENEALVRTFKVQKHLAELRKNKREKNNYDERDDLVSMIK